MPLVATDGRMLELLVHPAEAKDPLWRCVPARLSRSRHLFVKLAYADSAYASPRAAMATLADIEIVRRFADRTVFVVHPQRWVVERTSAWLIRNRRVGNDFEHSIRAVTAFLHAASAMLLVRRLARYA